MVAYASCFEAGAKSANLEGVEKGSLMQAMFAMLLIFGTLGGLVIAILGHPFFYRRITKRKAGSLDRTG